MAATLGCQMLDRFSANEQNSSNNNIIAVSNLDNSNQQPAGQGNCVNAYYPVGANVERTYKVAYENETIPTQNYTQSYSDVAANKFTERNRFKDVENAVKYECTAEGLQGLQFNNGGIVSSGNLKATLETVKSEGITIPKESRWQVGEKWTNIYNVNQTVKTGEKVDGKGEAVITINNEIVAEESVSVAAGTFQAWKVKSTLVLRYTSLRVGGVNVPVQPVTVNTNSWYAKNTGMVKSLASGIGQNATTELISTNSR